MKLIYYKKVRLIEGNLYAQNLFARNAKKNKRNVFIHQQSPSFFVIFSDGKTSFGVRMEDGDVDKVIRLAAKWIVGESKVYSKKDFRMAASFQNAQKMFGRIATTKFAQALKKEKANYVF